MVVDVCLLPACDRQQANHTSQRPCSSHAIHYQFSSNTLTASETSSFASSYSATPAAASISCEGHGPLGSVALIYRRATTRVNTLFLTLPGISSQVDKQVTAAVQDIAAKIAPDEPEATRYITIPKHGWDKEKLSQELLRLSGLPRTRWEDGKVSGAVYHGEDSLLEVQAQAMKLWSVANPIHPDVFPAVRKMEAEIVRMVGDLFHSPKDEGCGVTTRWRH